MDGERLGTANREAAMTVAEMTVAEQLEVLQKPCGHQHHRDCGSACACYDPAQGGEHVDFAGREPFTGTGIGPH